MDELGKLVGLAGSIFGMLQDPIAWVALIICFAAGRSNRTFLVPILLACAFQIVVALIVRPNYLISYAPDNADKYLIEDQLYYLCIRSVAFWSVWFVGSKTGTKFG
jgi:hypothetical protein